MYTSKLPIALAQIDTCLGDLQANLEKHLAYIEEARSQGAELIVFPELSLTGYALQDLAPTVACQPNMDDAIFRHLLQASRKLDLVVGFVDEDSRHRFYIAGAYLSQGEVLHVHHKIYLPTYGIFDESRFFAPGDRARAFDTRFGRIGLLICEDFWHISPPYLLWQDGADVLLFTSASPGRGLTDQPKLDSSRWVELVNQAYASLFTTFVAHSNRTGYEDGLNFWGGSTIFGPNSVLLSQGPYFKEALVFSEIDLNQLHRTRARLPLLRDEKPDWVRAELDRLLQSR